MDKASTKNKLRAEIRSDFYTIWVLTDQISSKKQTLCQNSFLYFISTL